MHQQPDLTSGEILEIICIDLCNMKLTYFEQFGEIPIMLDNNIPEIHDDDDV